MMRELIIKNLSSEISKDLVEDIFSSYEELLAKQRSNDLEGALTKGGRFVEHCLRALESIRTGKIPKEIKSVATTIKHLENDTNLHDSLRFMIPRVLYGMVYNIRSKRDAVHVKEIDPTQIDVAMAVHAASWVVAEFLRLYHVTDEGDVKKCMQALSRTSIPFIETVDGEVFVGRKVKGSVEMLLLLANANMCGMSRAELGNSAKCSPATVTTTIKSLMANRFVHFSSEKRYFITSQGELELALWLSQQ